jgi:hypothetical protein
MTSRAEVDLVSNVNQRLLCRGGIAASAIVTTGFVVDSVTEGMREIFSISVK